MLLRNKLSLITLFFFLIAALGLSMALNYQNRLQQDQSAKQALGAQFSLWEKVVDSSEILLKDRAVSLKGLSLSGLTDNELRKKLSDQASLLKEESTVQRLELYAKDGKQVFSSDQTYFPARTIGSTALQSLFENAKDHSGMVIDSERQTLLVHSFLVGEDYLMVLSKPIDQIMIEFEGLTRSQSLLINRRGRLLSGVQEALWERLENKVELNLANPVQIIETDDQYYQLTFNRVDGAFHDIGFNITVREITDAHDDFIQLQWLTYGGMALFLIFACIGLWGYLRHSLNPLGDAIDTLGRLAQGDYKQQMQVASGRDEVARIGTSILKFHKNLIRLDRMKKARDHRGKRQSMIIRRELSQLAETLDENARQKVLDDLNEIESQFDRSGPEEGASGRELAAMALTLSRLRERIQSQHHELEKTIFELEEALKSKTAYLALQQELAIGARVQLALLPEDLPETDQFEITGYMKPAKEVGGDFYDFFMLDENRLAVVIADVSGKGIPAALFMAITRTTLRATADIYERPAPCIQALNDQVCADNREELFVTLFYAIIDLKKGLLSYTNAGHNPTYLLSGEQVTALPMTGDVALGVMDGLDYSEADIDLKSGDALFFYTDGITEAMNEQNEEFGTKIMESDLGQHQKLVMKALLSNVVDSVEKFSGDAPQADDITCVGIRIK